MQHGRKGRRKVFLNVRTITHGTRATPDCALLSVEGVATRKYLGVPTPSPHTAAAAAATKVYSEFGRGCNSRLNRIWYYAMLVYY